MNLELQYCLHAEQNKTILCSDSIRNMDLLKIDQTRWTKKCENVKMINKWSLTHTQTTPPDTQSTKQDIKTKKTTREWRC